MSWQASQWAMRQTAGSGPAKAVLLVIAEASGDNGCFLSHRTIAERAEISERCAWQQVQALESRRLITRTPRRDQHGQRTSDLIVPNMDGQPARDAVRIADTNPHVVQFGEQPQTALHDKPNRTSRQNQPARRAEEPVRVEPVRGEPVAAKASKAKSRETAIPDGFPNDDAIAWAANHLRSVGWDIDARCEADRFRDRNLAKGGRYVDWMAAFRTWIKNAIGFAEKDGRKPTLLLTVAPMAPILEPWRSRVVAFADPGNRFWNVTDWGPAPGKPGCAAPGAILAEFGFGPAKVVPFARPGAA